MLAQITGIGTDVAICFLDNLINRFAGLIKRDIFSHMSAFFYLFVIKLISLDRLFLSQDIPPFSP